MKFLAPLLIASASAFVPRPIIHDQTSLSMASETDAFKDLKALQEQSNPLIKYWDPLSLGSSNFWDQSNEATIGFLRQAELKHGRVAMAAFVGYCVQSNFVFPWPQTLAGDPFPSADLSPEAQWDEVPLNAKFQILLVIGFLEIWDECGGNIDGNSHYMRGRRPGDYPSFEQFSKDVHPVLNLYDPFGLFKKMSAEKKEKRLLMELNNGRLAMIGIFGFLAADSVPGSVPALKDIAMQYDGNVMIPFSGDFSLSVENAPVWGTVLSTVAVVAASLNNQNSDDDGMAPATAESSVTVGSADVEKSE